MTKGSKEDAGEDLKQVSITGKKGGRNPTLCRDRTVGSIVIFSNVEHRKNESELGDLCTDIFR
jgi:hypothetical protein